MWCEGVFSKAGPGHLPILIIMPYSEEIIHHVTKALRDADEDSLTVQQIQDRVPNSIKPFVFNCVTLLVKREVLLYKPLEQHYGRKSKRKVHKFVLKT